MTLANFDPYLLSLSSPPHPSPPTPREFLRPWAVGSHEYLIAFHIRKQAEQAASYLSRSRRRKTGRVGVGGEGMKAKKPQKGILINIAVVTGMSTLLCHARGQAKPGWR